MWALEGLLAGVRTFVILEHVLVGEASVARPADERPLFAIPFGPAASIGG